MNKAAGFFACLGVVSLAAAADQRAQWAQQAQAAVEAPLKLAVKPLQDGPKAGEPIDFKVELQNGKSLPAATSKDTKVEIQLLNSSGQVVGASTCNIAAKQTDGKCSLQAPKSGVYKFKAKPEGHELIDSTGYVLVRPDTSRKKLEAQPKKQEARPSSPQSRIDRSYGGARLLNAAYFFEEDGQEPTLPVARACDATPSRSAANIVLAINEGAESGGAFRAGIESATIQAFFQAEDGGSAPSDIRVWLSQDHGAIDHQPLVIPKCSFAGEAHLSSKYPVQASIVYNVVPSAYPVKGPTTLHASFVRPIVGIGVVPTGKQTLSLIDRGPIVVSFFDAEGNTIPTDLVRTVKFVSGSSIIGAKEQSVSLKPGDFSAETVILPFWLGSGSIFVTADRLKTAMHEVEVVGTSVFLVCLLGGLVGALVLFFTAGGTLYSRVFVGIAAGIVLTWAYVFGLLPKVDWAIAHNFISVFVVSILGGYLGIKAFDKVIGVLGW